VYILHSKYYLFHGRIGKNTIYFPDERYKVDEVLLDIFSSPATFLDESKSPDKNYKADVSSPATLLHGSKDCLQIFRTIQEFVGTDLPYPWLGDETLDHLYKRVTSDKTNSWPDVVSLCDHLQIDPYAPESDFWTTIEVRKDFHIRFETAYESSKLSLYDVKNYLYADAFLQCRRSRDDHSQLFKKAISAMSQTDPDGNWISVAAYQIFTTHMERRHGSYIGRALAWELPASRIDEGIPSPIKIDMKLQVPYHAAHGLINVSYLRHFASLSFDPNILKTILHNCYEVRGVAGIGGVYVSIDHLSWLEDQLKLQLDRSKLTVPRDKSLYAITHDKSFLIAPNEFTILFPVDRETSIVQMPGSQQSLAEFLAENFDEEAKIDAAMEHNPELLSEKVIELQPDDSYEGSIKPSTISGHMFEFGKRTYDNEESKSLDRTESWVDQRRVTRRKIRRGDMYPGIRESLGNQELKTNSNISEVSDTERKQIKPESPVDDSNSLGSKAYREISKDHGTSPTAAHPDLSLENNPNHEVPNETCDEAGSEQHSPWRRWRDNRDGWL
jgi:hypothetical protein